MMQTIGDLAMSFGNRASNVRIRTEMNTLVQEMTSGLKSDIRTPLSGDLAPVAIIERSLSNLSAYETIINESDLFLTAAQSALSQVTGYLDGLADHPFDLENSNNPALIANFGKEASHQFDSLVNTLNTKIAGRALFAGNDTATQPVGNSESILDDLLATLPAGATAEDISTATDAFFAAGGGFDAHYLGSDTALSPFRISPQATMSFTLTAQSSEIRDALAATAKAALIDRGVLAGNTGAQRTLIRTSGLDLVNASAGIVAVRGEVGISENRLETARTRNAVETDTLEMARAELVGADPFETASKLQMVQTQLETFYTLTARLSRLNLTGYLR
ncbi:flagellin [Oceaniglobus ichthyenteri]|uniref:flagellin n=1 Tax=Oceaniglobus ichthyenteri TaxID=2136177 RepID=UPI000D3535C0|nr:flagellin [Oceaniglobus ichthyenteri]